MGKRSWKKVVALAFGFVLLCSSFTTLATDEKIEHSKKEYSVIIQNTDKVFIGNKKPVDWKVGDKYFLSYKVESVEENSVVQSGLVCTDTPDAPYPHSPEGYNGGMKFASENLLCEEGYTYFLRFEVKEDGMDYIAARAKDDESKYLNQFTSEWPLFDTTKKTWQQMTGTTKITNFGVWFAEGGKVNAKLTDVNCYDEDGNDLGIYGNKALGVSVIDEEAMMPRKDVDHYYNFSLDKASMIFFGSARASQAKTIFLEYTVKNLKGKDMNQSGVVMTQETAAVYPHETGKGYMNYQNYTKETGPIQTMVEGATYLVRFDRTDTSFEALVKRTLPNGQVDYIAFPHFWGTDGNDWPHAGMWIGEDCKVTADFVNCKAYDADGNNLAITTNQADVVVEHFGELEDYSKCDAVYYCKENNTFITLDDECNASKRTADENVSKMGKYEIRKTKLSLSIGEETEEFEYLYSVMDDAEGNRYVRLREVDVIYHTQFIGGEVLDTVRVSAAKGFKIEKPGEPKIEGRTFKYWKTAENKEFNFDDVVTETTHLYASWEGEETWESVSAAVVRKEPIAVIAIAVSAILILGTIAVIVMIAKGKVKGEKKNEEV